MNTYLIADQTLQHILNALFSFLLFSFLTAFCIRLFSIKSYRLKAFFRLLPPIRLALEPLFWLLPAKAAFFNAGIFSCSHPLQYFVFSNLPDAAQQELLHHGLYTISGILLIAIPLPLTMIIIAAIVAFSTYRFLTTLVLYTASIRKYKEIQQRAICNPRPITQLKLLQNIRKLRIVIVASDEVAVPVAVWGKCIIVPKDLMPKLSQEEYEAILSHELEHLAWYDNVTRAFCRILSAFYWWVPMDKWTRKMEHEQELACDFSLFRYGIPGFNLASALKKTIQNQSKTDFRCAALTHNSKPTAKHGVLERIHLCLLSPYQTKQNPFGALLGILILFSLFLTVGFTIC
jgi:beta-lactamase regulating signal transducer with metallopeptidase domain